MLPKFYLRHWSHREIPRADILLPVSDSDGLLISVVLASNHPYFLENHLPYVKFMTMDQEHFRDYLLESTKKFLLETQKRCQHPSGHSYIYHHHTTFSATGDRYELATSYCPFEKMKTIHSLEELVEIMSTKISSSPYEIERISNLFNDFCLSTPSTPKQFL